MKNAFFNELIKFNDVYFIHSLIKQINANYELYYNKNKMRYEVHDTSKPLLNSLCVTTKNYPDQRLIDKLQETRIENIENIIKNIEIHNNKLEFEKQNKITSLAKEQLTEVIKYATQKPETTLSQASIRNIIKNWGRYMTKEIIKLTATLLGLDDVVNYLLNENTTETEPLDEVATKINDLLVFTNYVIREVTKDYYPLSYEEKVSSDNQCQIYYNTLSKNAIAIKDIKNNSNLSVTFNLYPDYIKVGSPNSVYKIFYNYVPECLQSINQEISLPMGLDYFIICYGVASEYALSKLLYNEAEMWETKFKNSLENIKSRVGERRFFARRLK